MTKAKRVQTVWTEERWLTFVHLWREADNVGEVAEKMGISRQYASLRASHLRKLGVEMKDMTKPNPPVDMDKLKKAAKGGA